MFRERRRILERAGLVDPWPTREQRRIWAWIDDRKPPEGEADGEFASHMKWVNHANSWIGGTGAKLFDTKDRPCRNGADMMQARDDDAFPVRWYYPQRFGKIHIPDARTLRIRKALFLSGKQGLTLDEMRQQDGLKRVTVNELNKRCSGLISETDGRFFLTGNGCSEVEFQIFCEKRSHY